MNYQQLLQFIKMFSKYSLVGIVLTCLFLNTLLAGEVNSQSRDLREVKISLNLHDAKLSEVFKAVEQETGYSFAFDNEQDIANRVVSLNVKRESIYKLLLLLSEKANVKFMQVDEVINVAPYEVRDFKNKEPKVIIQTRTITGKVTSMEDNEGLPGVNVVEKGTSNGTVTDVQGNYSLEVSEGATLVFSSVGYTQEEVEVGNRSTIDLVMAQDIKALEEIVVVGYGAQKKRDLTGSVASVKSEEIKSFPITSVEQSMQGRVPGVRIVQNNGAPGAPMTVRIRGGNSIVGGNEPLYVVDGFPIINDNSGNTNALASINPNDIESIEILKDASATAIYGARGANGVVIITTKQGKEGTNVIDFESYYGWQNVRKQIDLLNADQFMTIANLRAENDGNAPSFPNPNAIEHDTDWQDEIYQVAPIQNYTLSFSGGNEATRYAVSGNYFDQQGILINSGFERGALRMNFAHDFNDRIKFSNNLTISRTLANRSFTEDGQRGVINGALQGAPTVPVIDEEGNYGVVNPYFFSPTVIENPVALATERLDRQTISRILGNVALEIEILDGLKWKTLLGADYLDRETDGYTPRIFQLGQPAGMASQSFGKRLSFLNENTLNYAKSFNEMHSLNALVGYTWQNQDTEDFSLRVNGFVTDQIENNNLSAGETVNSPFHNLTDWTLISWIGRVNYILNDKYLFTLTGRADGSSKFGEGNKWGYFPSAAFAWRMSDENFIRNLNLFSNLKLRTSWGITGNQEIGVYQSLGILDDNQFILGLSNINVGFEPGNLANPDLKWETTEQINFGVDMGFWDEKLRLTLDYYTKNTRDLLAFVPLPQSTGFSSSLQNIGEIRNSGIELSLGTDIIYNDNIRWDISANFSANRNEVVKLAKGSDIIPGTTAPNLGSSHIVREGEPLGSFFGFQENGLDENGNIVFVDNDDNGEINEADRVIIGNPYPDFIYGITSNVSFKNFNLSIFFDGVQGVDIFNANLFESASSFHRGSNQVADLWGNYWVESNPDPNAKYPRISANTNFRPSDRFVEDGSYLRLRNIRLGYNLPVQNLNLQQVFRSVNIYVSAQNLLTFTDYSWYDPDVNTFGSSDLRVGTDLGSYPTAKTYTIGLNVSF